MPFSYFGAKHGVAKVYPFPRYPTIVEPFAGAAGYACFHQRRTAGRYQLILNDLDPLVTDTWHRLQQTEPADLDAVDASLTDERTDDMLLKGLSGGHDWRPESRKITSRMRRDWPFVRRRIEATLPHIRDASVSNGDYRDLPDIEATWFIDPPYETHRDHPNSEHDVHGGARRGGNAYRHNNRQIDYDELADWCQTRQGQVIVCEQSPAAWLPFTPIVSQSNASQWTESKTELVWCSDQQQLSMFDT